METKREDKAITDNELIAEFLQLERTKDIWENGEYAYTMKSPSSVFNKWVIPSRMQFDSSWDWLMPVVDKIESLGHYVKIRRNETEITTHPIEYYDLQIEDLKIRSVYKAVIDFIKWYKWYNQRSKKATE